MEEAGEKDGIGLEQGKTRLPKKALRIRVAIPTKEEVARGKGSPTRIRIASGPSVKRCKQARSDEEKLILDGTTRRSQRIAARLAENDEFPLRSECWRMFKVQESLPPASMPARMTKDWAQRLLPTGVAPLATRIALRVIADSEPEAVTLNMELPKLAVLDSLKLKAYITHLDSCLSQANPAKDCPPRGRTSPAVFQRSTGRHRVRWWDEVGKENEHSQLAHRQEPDSWNSKSASFPPKFRLPMVQKDSPGPLEELGRQPLQPHSDKMER